MLLLLVLIPLDLNSVVALTELNLVEVIKILSINRFVFCEFGARKSKRSEKVLWLHSELLQNIFLTASSKIVSLSCNEIS